MTTTEYVNVPRSLEILQNQVSEQNYEVIQGFIDHCAAEGIGDSQQQRLVYALKTLIQKFTDQGFTLEDASEDELKSMIAELNRSDYAESTKAKFRASVKKFYKIQNGGDEHPDKVSFFSVHRSRKQSTVSRDDLFTKEELQALFSNFNNSRDRAFTYALYETAARPGELLGCSIGDFTTNEKGDFIYLEGLKDTPDRTNQLVRSGRPLREWVAQHPLGGEAGNIKDSSAPLWVKIQQQKCRHCGKSLNQHNNSCDYEPDHQDKMNYSAYRRRFKAACENAEIPENKRRPYNLRHTRLTEVATFMGYEQLNKFAGWVPGSSRAKVYVHLNNDDVNKAIRDQYGLDTEEDQDQPNNCPFCETENQPQYTECRNCGRVLSLQKKQEKQEKQKVLERLSELEEEGILERLSDIDQIDSS